MDVRCCSTAPSSNTTWHSSSGRCCPHEVVGISGGNKYFFPGVAGQEIIDVSHWIGALITSAEIIGTTDITPVRALINEGAVPRPGRETRLVRRRRVRLARPALGLVRRHDLVVGQRGRGVRGHPRHLPRRAGQSRHLDHPADVRGHLDRRQGLLQARAGRGRRRRGRSSTRRTSPRSRRATPRSTRSATTAATTS